MAPKQNTETPPRERMISFHLDTFILVTMLVAAGILLALPKPLLVLIDRYFPANDEVGMKFDLGPEGKTQTILHYVISRSSEGRVSFQDMDDKSDFALVGHPTAQGIRDFETDADWNVIFLAGNHGVSVVSADGFSFQQELSSELTHRLKWDRKCKLLYALEDPDYKYVHDVVGGDDVKGLRIAVWQMKRPPGFLSRWIWRWETLVICCCIGLFIARRITGQQDEPQSATPPSPSP